MKLNLEYSNRAASAIKYIWSAISGVSAINAVFEYSKESNIFLPLVLLSAVSAAVAYKFGRRKWIVVAKEKNLLIYSVSNEIKNYKDGNLEKLSTNSKLADSLKISPYSVSKYLKNLSKVERDYRVKILQSQGGKNGYQRGLGKLTSKQLSELAKKGGRKRIELYGNPNPRTKNK